MSDPVDPWQAKDAVAFVAALREVKERSGLTYRRIQHRASAAGAWLPASTLGTALNRETLPRAELVASFLTACGLDREQIKRWLAARRQLECKARQPTPAPAPPVVRVRVPAAISSKWPRVAIVGALTFLLFAIAPSAPQWASSDSALLTRPSPGPYHIRVAISNRCLSELPDSDSGFIFQADCELAFPPMTLVGGDDNRYRIRTERAKDPGCLGVLSAYGRSGGILSDSDCAEFRLEPVTSPLPGYRIRVLPSELCLGVPDDSVGDSVRNLMPVMRNHCDAKAAGQVFRFTGR